MMARYMVGAGGNVFMAPLVGSADCRRSRFSGNEFPARDGPESQAFRGSSRVAGVSVARDRPVEAGRFKA